jgi:ech hydrogenase subunit D
VKLQDQLNSFKIQEIRTILVIDSKIKRMKKIDTSLEKLRSDIANFYRFDQHHFIVMNGVDLGNEKMELQWFFCDYAHPCETTMFQTIAGSNDLIPSIKDIVLPAWVAEAELVDLLGLNIENTSKGFVLEDDFDGAPLKKKN